MSEKPRLVLTIDTREQLPLEFKAGVFDEVKVAKLEYADYGCEINGEKVPIYFERKSIADLFGTLTNGNKRFKKMLHRAREAGSEVILLVEGSLRDIASGYSHSSVPGSQIIRTVFSLWVRYGLTVQFCPDRRTMARTIEEMYEAVARNYALKQPVI